MFYLSTNWFPEFKCCAGDCTVTCCSTNWGIRVDTDTYQKYQNLNHKFKENILSEIDEFEPGSYRMKKHPSSSLCPMLDSQGLCEIVKEVGPDYLCNTCQIFPRISHAYGDITEINVTISCPVVAEFLLSGKEISFLSSESEEASSVSDYDYSFYNSMALARTVFVELLQENPQIPLLTKLFFIKSANDKIHSLRAKNMLSDPQVENAIANLKNVDLIAASSDQILPSIENIHARTNAMLSLLVSLEAPDMAFYFGNQEHILDQLLEIKNMIQTDVEQFYVDLERFHAFCSDYQTAYENYFVYQTFAYFIDSENNDYFETAVIELLSIQLLAFRLWKTNDYQLSPEDYRDIIAKTARNFEHTKNRRKAITQLLELFHLGNDAYTMLWILI